MKTYPIIIKATNYTIKIDGSPGDFQFPTREEREQWTAALRSGVYEQGTRCLSPAVGQYCCLGVLHFLQDGKEPTPRNHDEAHKAWGSFGLPSLSGILIPWVNGNFPALTTVVFTRGHENALAQLNDLGMSFADLADIIDIVYNPETYE